MQAALYAGDTRREPTGARLRRAVARLQDDVTTLTTVSGHRGRVRPIEDVARDLDAAWRQLRRCIDEGLADLRRLGEPRNGKGDRHG